MEAVAVLQVMDDGSLAQAVVEEILSSGRICKDFCLDKLLPERLSAWRTFYNSRKQDVVVFLFCAICISPFANAL